MTDEQKIQIQTMRMNNQSYSEIAAVLGISKETVKKHCQRHPVTDVSAPSAEHLKCKYCGKDIPTVHGRRQPLFCSTECRRAWWKAHPNAGQRKAYYTIICAGCGREFQSYGNANRKYCSHDCYIRSRFKGGEKNG